MKYQRWEKWAIGAVLFLMITINSWSLFKSGLFPSHDPVSSARIAQMSIALKEGQFPVRWVGNFAKGYGMPLFEFYGPLVYYYGAIFYLWGLSIELVIKIIYLTATILIVVSSYYLGLALSQKKWVGLITSVLISLAPYRAVNLFVRGAISETYGLIGLVIALLGVVYIVRYHHKMWVLTLGLIIMILSHNLVTIMSGPFLLIWTISLLLIYPSQKYQTTLIKLINAVSLALLLTTFYWLPLIEERSWINLELMTKSFPYHDFFVYSLQWYTPMWGYGGAAPLPYNDQSYFLGYGQLFLLGLGGVYTVYSLFKKRFTHSINIYIVSTTLAILSLLMMHPRSQFIWDQISALHIFQFPWRFLGPASIFLGIAASVWVGELDNNFLRKKIMRGLILILVFGSVAHNQIFFQPSGYLPKDQKMYLTNPEDIQQQVSPGYPDFTLIDYHQLPVSDGDLVFTDQVTSQVIQNHFTNKEIVLTNHRPQTVELAIAYFPGWTVSNLKTGELIDTFVSADNLVSIDLPEGEYHLSIKIRKTTPQVMADVISGVSFMLCLLILLGCVVRKFALKLF